MTTARNALDTFDLLSLPDLDIVVLGALELFMEESLPDISIPFTNPLVIGSGNASVTGKLLFGDMPAIFADESSFSRTLLNTAAIDGAVLISAFGGKHAIPIAETLHKEGVSTYLFTNNPHSEAGDFFDESMVRIFPKNREPYTYNTSTYLGMILAKTKEDPQEIKRYIAEDVMPRMPDMFSSYNAFTIILPAKFGPVAAMLKTKFDELFGPMINGRIFTEEEIKHAKTIVPSDREYFIELGVSSDWYAPSDRRFSIPLPNDADFAALFAVGYYVIGHIQKQHPPYFKNNITAYTEKASAVFGHLIEPIVA